MRAAPHTVPTSLISPPAPSLLDYTALSLAALVCSQPYYAAWRVGPSGLFAIDLAMVALLLATCVLVACRGARPLAFTTLVLIGGVLAAYVAVGLSRGGETKVLGHARWFLPLVVSAALLCARIRITRSTASTAIAWMVSVSASVALLVHFLAKDNLSLIAGEIVQLEVVRDEGRLYWFCAPSALLVPAVLLCPSRRGYARWLVTSVTLLALVLTMSRTLIAAFLTILLISALCRGTQRLRIAWLVIGLFGLCCGAYWLLLAVDPGALSTGLERFAGGADEVDRAFKSTRVPLYEGYFSRLDVSWLWGQGLGISSADPVSASRDAPYVTDISLLTVWLPLGILGASSLLLFLLCCVRYVRSDTSVHGSFLRWCLLIAVISSANYDLFTRSLFVIAFSFVVACRHDDWSYP